MSQTQKILSWIGIILILMIGYIHVIDAKECFEEAIYKGWLFYANGAASLIAAYGIYRKDSWGWNLALLVAVGSLCGYVASRTVGLPLIPAEPDAWFEPLGVAALTAETLLVAVFIAKQLKK